MNTPAVSVLLPVYNAGPHFEAALLSILQQTFDDFECLVLDDGSTDGSGALAERYAQQDPRIKVIRRENRGLVRTLNELVAMARAPLLARMDADDVSLPDRLALQVRAMQTRPDLVCLGGAHWLIDECNRAIQRVVPPADDEAIQALALRGHGSICHPTAMIRADAMRQVGGYRPDFYPAEDLDLWLRLGELGKLANLDEAVLHYRIHSGSISGVTADGRQREAMNKGCESAWHRRGLTNVQFEATEAWRPTEAIESRLRFALRYGWSAYASGFRRTAVVYGAKALRLRPWSGEGWRLLLVSLLKPRPADGTGS